ncbi:MAG: MFS transporter, partial [Burkholderiales bacterium]|nr:MFS transporter [Burkholderiales bacterium]
IGIFAPALMLFFRLLQGLAIGGELPSMIVYSSETIPEKRGYAMGGVFAGTISGLIPGMIINLLILHFFTKEQIDDFGWRIPFLFGGFLCVIAYFVRKELHETKAFKEIKQHIGIPFVHVLSNYFGRVIIGAGLVAIMATPIILLIIFMPTYLVKIAHVDANLAGDAVLVAAILSVIFVYIGGIIAQKFNLVISMFICLFFIIITASICYWTISLNNSMIFVGVGLFAIFQGILVTLPAVAISYLFPTDVRLTGVALSYNISFVLFGGLTPILVTAIVAETNLIYIIPVAILTIVSLFAAWATHKTKPYIN